MFTYKSLYLLPLSKGHLYWRERGTLSGSRIRGLTSLQGTPKHSKKWPTVKKVDTFMCTLVKMTTTFTTLTISLKSMYCTCGISKQNFTEIIRIIMNYKATWNVDCSSFCGRIKEKYFIGRLIITGNKSQLILIQETSLFRVHLPWFRGCPLNRNSTVMLNQSSLQSP